MNFEQCRLLQENDLNYLFLERRHNKCLLSPRVFSMNKMRFFYLLISLFLPLSLEALAFSKPETHYYGGNFKDSEENPIVVELTTNGTEVTGRYFYQKYGKDILLWGKKLPDNTLELTEGPKNAPSGFWTIQFSMAKGEQFGEQTATTSTEGMFSKSESAV